MTKKVEQKPSQPNKWDKRLAQLTSQALSLEEQAEYAEKESMLLERIALARKRLRTAHPPDMLDGVASGAISAMTSGVALWHRIPIPIRALFVLGSIVVLLLLIGSVVSKRGS